MAGPSLSFDASSPRTRPRGTLVDTALVLVVPPDSRCEGLRFSFEAHREGITIPGERGRPEHTMVQANVPVEQPDGWGPGEHVVRLPVPTPRYPLSFEGARVGVRWMLHAFARFAGEHVGSCVASMPVVITPRADEARVVVAPPNGDPDRVLERPETPSMENPFALAIVFGVFATLLYGIATVSTLRGDSPWGWFLGALPATALSAGAFVSARKRLRQRLADDAEGDATFETYGSPQRVITYDPDARVLDCEYAVAPYSPDLDPTVSLTVEEIVMLRDRSPSGGHQMKRRTLVESHSPMRCVEPGRYLADLSVPGLDDAPESLEASGCWLRWSVCVDPGIEGLPIERIPLRVCEQELVEESGHIVL